MLSCCSIFNFFSVGVVHRGEERLEQKRMRSCLGAANFFQDFSFQVHREQWRHVENQWRHRQEEHQVKILQQTVQERLRRHRQSTASQSSQVLRLLQLFVIDQLKSIFLAPNKKKFNVTFRAKVQKVINKVFFLRRLIRPEVFCIDCSRWYQFVLFRPMAQLSSLKSFFKSSWVQLSRSNY